MTASNGPSEYISNKIEPDGRRADVLFWILFLCGLTPWIVYTVHLAANGDILWLCTGLQRWLNGGTLVQDIYEPDPPFNMFTCLPPLLLSRATGMALHHASTLCSL